MGNAEFGITTKIRDLRIQEFRDSGMEGFRNLGIEGFLNSEFGMWNAE